MSNWNSVKFKNAAIEIIDGDRGVNYPKKTDFLQKGHCLFLNTGNVTENGFDFEEVDFITEERDNLLRKGKLQRGDLVLTTRGTVGNVAYFDDQVPFEHIRINSGMVILRVKSDAIDPYFLYVYLRSYLFKKQVLSQGSGSAQPQLPISSLNNILIPEVDLPDQKNRTALIADIDKKIFLNQLVSQKYFSMIEDIYDYWFNQFQFPNDEGKSYKLSNGKFKFNDQLKKDIPKNWSSGNILEVADLLGGGTPSKTKPEYWNGDIPFFTPTDSGREVYKIETESYISNLGLEKSTTRLFKKNTVFITARGSVGKLSLAGGDMAMNQSCYALRAKPDVSFAYIYMKAIELIRYLKVRSSGSVFKSIVSNDVERTFMPIPDQKTIKLFGDTVEPIFEKIELLSRENLSLKSVLNLLIPMAINGQIAKCAPPESKLRHSLHA